MKTNQLQLKIQQLRNYHHKHRADILCAIDLKVERRFFRLWQRLHDHTLTRLWNMVLPHWALPHEEAPLLIATVGYGRGELYPQSDLDVLIIFPNQTATITQAQQQAIEGWVQAVWDMGMSLSHRLITEQELKLLWADTSQEQIIFQTSLLETRCLSKTAARWHALKSQLTQTSDPIAFFYAKRHEQQQRHRRYNETPYSLEPNCKESPGGLRDAHMLTWLHLSSTQNSTLLSVVSLSNQESRTLKRSTAFLQRVRIALHTLRKRKDDRLSFDVQQVLALHLGISDTSKKRGSEQLMQSYYRAVRQIDQINAMILQNIEEFLKQSRAHNQNNAIPMKDPYFSNQNGYLSLRNPDDLINHPELLLQAFVHLCQDPNISQLSVSTIRALWNAKHLVNAQFRNKTSHRALFLQILSGAKGVVRSLRLMQQIGLLGCYLPAFRRVEGLMQHDLFHVYTVDQHTLTVVRHLRRLSMDTHSHEFPSFSARMRQLCEPMTLYIAALFHDIAKGRGGNHSELGADEAFLFCRQHSMSQEQTDRIIFLVRQHLLMSHTAQHQDLNNPSVIAEFCAQIPSKEDLLCLYLLTFADMRATAPNIWTTWKAQLLEQLYQQALAFFDQNHQDDESRLLNAVTQQYPNIKAEQISQFWKHMGDGYLLQHPVDTLAWHAQQILSIGTTGSPLCEIRASGPADFELVVYLKDAPYVLLRLLWVLQQYGCLVQQAQIHTSASGQVLDHLHVNVPSLIEEQRASWMTHLRDQLIETLQNSPENAAVLDRLPGASLGRLSARARHFPIATQVKFFFDSTGHYCVMSLVCRDRLGLLYAIARELAGLNISLHQAKINTLGQRVEDIFILDAAPFKQHAQIEAQLEQAILNLNI